MKKTITASIMTISILFSPIAFATEPVIQEEQELVTILQSEQIENNEEQVTVKGEMLDDDIESTEKEESEKEKNINQEITDFLETKPKTPNIVEGKASITEAYENTINENKDQSQIATILNGVFIAIQDSVDDVAAAGPGFWPATKAAATQVMAYLATPLAIAGLAVGATVGAALSRGIDMYEEYEEDRKTFTRNRMYEIKSSDRQD